MIRRDVQHMIRQMRRNPAFAMVSILLLGLGIGATTAVFGLVRGVVLRPLPYGHPERLAVVWEDLVREGNHTFSVAPPNAEDIRDRSGAFADVALQMTGGGMMLRGADGTRVIRPGMVSGNFFDLVDAHAALGRTLTKEDERNHALVVVLSDATWRERFAAQPDVIGHTITLDGVNYTVVGVMPPSFESPWVFKAPSMPAALWTPLSLPPGLGRNAALLQVIGRLRDGVTLSDARTRLNTLGLALAHDYPATNGGVRFNVVGMRDQIVGAIRMPLLLLLGSIMLLLLIACANLANLLLQRTLGRRHEIAVRTAVGATRMHIMRQLIVENTTLAMIGGAFGAWIGAYGTRLLVALAPADTPRLAGVRTDGTVLAFTALATLVVAVALAFAPAFRTSADLGSVMRSARSPRSDRFRAAFTLLQVALAMVLLIAGSLFVRSFGRLTAVDPGFQTRNVQSVRVALPQAKYSDDARQIAFFDALLARVHAIPGVVDAAVTSRPPLDPPFGYARARVAGAPSLHDQDMVGYRAVTPEYLDALRVPVLSGRMLSTTDGSKTDAVALVNMAFAKKYFGAASPLHQRLFIGDDTTTTVEVIGMAGDMSNGSLDAPPIPEMFVPLSQNALSAATLVTRTSRDVPGIQNAIVRTITEMDAGVATQDARTMDDIAASTVALPRFSAFLISVFATLALLLAGIGVYGVFAQAVGARSREIGIRSALGASASRLVLPILAEGAVMTLGGILFGMVAALALARFVQSQLFGIAATDASTFVGAAAAMMLIALVACAIPARRALQLNPATVMRSE